MGTVVKDEAAILKVLEKNPKGIRHTELLHAVRRTVRSPTTFQKRLGHLEEMGRIQMKEDLNDMRAKVITSTAAGTEVSFVLDAIELLTNMYLAKAVMGRNARGVPVLQTVTGEPIPLPSKRPIPAAALKLLEIAYRTWMQVEGDRLREFYRKKGYSDLPAVYVRGLTKKGGAIELWLGAKP